MSAPNFIDYVKIHAQSGNGGPGSVHFRKEKYVPQGGPDGGDGGRGGHVIFRGNRNKWTLLHLKYTKHVKAGHGQAGGKQKSTGASGNDVVVDVPLGTVVKNADTEEKLAEITEDGQEVTILSGGKGGLGNWHFRNSVNQAPEYAQPGEPLQEAWLQIELKVLADVGLVGFPNAGKSTLLSVVSAAKPKIGAYPFTTLSPNLGVVSIDEERSFVMADIPGLIEGAAEGKGLGTRFLRHVERNSVLLFIISSEADDLQKELTILKKELKQYSPELMDKDHLVAISKADLLPEEELEEKIQKMNLEYRPLVFSSVTQQGLTQLKDHIFQLLAKEHHDKNP